jgi:hypothetical protein
MRAKGREQQAKKDAAAMHESMGVNAAWERII